jgi:hypothetical protein
VGAKLILSFSEWKHGPKVFDNKGPAVYIDDVAEILRKFVIGIIKYRTLRETIHESLRGI